MSEKPFDEEKWNEEMRAMREEYAKEVVASEASCLNIILKVLQKQMINLSTAEDSNTLLEATNLLTLSISELEKLAVKRIPDEVG